MSKGGKKESVSISSMRADNRDRKHAHLNKKTTKTEGG